MGVGCCIFMSVKYRDGALMVVQSGTSIFHLCPPVYYPPPRLAAVPLEISHFHHCVRTGVSQLLRACVSVCVCVFAPVYVSSVFTTL